MLTMYGLSNCDSCKKAQNWLKRVEKPFVFTDYRANPIAPETLSGWADQLGGFDAMLNKSSTTWRNLLPNKKTPGSKPEYLMLLKVQYCRDHQLGWYYPGYFGPDLPKFSYKLFVDKDATEVFISESKQWLLYNDFMK